MTRTGCADAGPCARWGRRECAFAGGGDAPASERSVEVVDECLDCRVFLEARDPEVLRAALRAERARGERELEEVCQVLQRIADGDPTARVVETPGPGQRPRLRRAVNETAQSLTSLVEDFHEVAIGLAEHFDVLHRVAQGDLSARATGAPRLEILQCLASVANTTIESLAQQVAARGRAEVRTARLAAAVEHAGEAIVITDTSGGVEYANPSFERMSGYSLREALGRNLLSLSEGSLPESFCAEIWGRIGRGEAWSGHFVNRRKDGTAYEADCTVSPARDRDGGISRCIAVMRDVTAEVELKKRMTQGQRLEALGTLAGGMAHEFNNLLAVMIGFTELAMDFVPAESPGWGDLKRVLEAADRARGLISQIMEFSRKRETSVQPFAIAPLVKETMRLLRATLPSTIDVKASVGDVASGVLADPSQVQGLLMNLATNATHAMRGAGGVLTVALEELAPDARPEEFPDELPEDRYVLLTVQDTGCGMSPAVLERIFEPFYTTKPQGEGTGLGLAVVHGIVRGAGGAIRVDSRLGQGSCFRVYLPAVALDSTGCASEGLGARGGTEHILLVDDEEMLLTAVSAQLSRLGYRVTPASSGEEALGLYAAEPDAFDLVLTDQTMPGLTGAELARAIHRLRPGTPVVLETGFSEFALGELAEKGGVSRLLMKPLRTFELADAIRGALDERPAGRAP